ncbi:methyltransferase domain-containing protein [Desulfovibrio piger]
MECTGERYLPEFDRDWTLEHLHRYLLACELAAGKTVLDIACGDGYGSAMLARHAAQVTGVDIDTPTVERARGKYVADNLRFLQGSATDIPLDDDSVDLVISFETIEHLMEQDRMLYEIRRVLRPEGFLLISSPDKYEYSDVPGYHNEFHLKELYRQEFEALLQKHFSRHALLGQRVVFGSLIASAETRPFLSWSKVEEQGRTEGLAHAVYHIAVAGDGPLPPLPSSLFRAPLEHSDHVRQLEAALHYTQECLDAREHELEDARTMLSSLVNSRSWKLTAPLRALAALLRQS